MQSSELTPPNAAEIQRIVQKRLAAWTDGLQEKVTIDWRDSRLPIEVITVPVDLVYYNPHTRRIRAQRGVDHTREKALKEEPYSTSSQFYLHELLQWNPSSPGQIDPAFDKLKEDLREHGQDEPGLMTRSGVLINGNTRRAALKILGQPHMTVGVLPEDTSRGDLDALELALQLRKTFKRNYSFVNELLAISEMVENGVPTQQILRAFRMKKPRLERSNWLLKFIDEAITRSQCVTSSGESVTLRQFDFEQDQGQLEELYRSWHTLNQTDSTKATLLREARLIGIVLDFAKTDLRAVEGDFFEKYLLPRLPDEFVPAVPDSSGKKSVPGLPDLELPTDPAAVLQLRSLADKVLQAKALEKHASVEDPLDKEHARNVSVIHDTYKKAKENAGADNDLRRKGVGPSDRLVNAGDQIDFATLALTEAKAVGSLDVARLEDSLENLRSSLVKFSQVLERLSEHDDMDLGFAWVKAAASVEPPETTE